MNPFFSFLEYKDSDYQQDNGFIRSIQVTGDNPLFSIKVSGPNGFSIPYTSSIGFADLNNLQPGPYTLTVKDSLNNEEELIITLIEKAEVILSVTLTDNACQTSGLCDCELTVSDFIHNSTDFRYDVYDNNNNLLDTYTGTTGGEVHVFTGLCINSYVVIATELDGLLYTYSNPYNCAEGETVITPVDILTSWSRFCFYAPHLLFGKYVAYDNAGIIITTEFLDPGIDLVPNYFWNDSLNTNRLTPLVSEMADNEGENDGPSASDGEWYYNTKVNKYFVKIFNVWVTYSASENRGILTGNPTSFDLYTGSSQWALSPLVTQTLPLVSQYVTTEETSPGVYTVVRASNKLGLSAQMVECYKNSFFFNGFYSNCGYKDYTHEVTVGSTHVDNDEIGIVIGAFKDTLGEYGPVDFVHYLCLRINNESTPTIGVYYNLGTSVEAFRDNNIIDASSEVLSTRMTSGTLLPNTTYIIQTIAPGDEFLGVNRTGLGYFTTPNFPLTPNTTGGVLGDGTYNWTNGTVVYKQSPFYGITSLSDYVYKGYVRFKIEKTNSLISISSTKTMGSKELISFSVQAGTLYVPGVYNIVVVNTNPSGTNALIEITIPLTGNIFSTSNTNIYQNIVILDAGSNFINNPILHITGAVIPKTGAGLDSYITCIANTGEFSIGDINPYTPLFQFDLNDKNTWLQSPSYAVGDELKMFFEKPTRIGYLTASQASTQFFDINFEGTQSNTTSDLLEEAAAESIVEIPGIPCWTITDCSNPSNTKIVHVTNLLGNENLYPDKIYRFSLSEQEYICWRVDPAPGCPPESIPTTRLEEFNNCEECILEVRQCFDLVACPNTCDNILNINSFDFTPYIGGQVILNGDSSCIYEPFAIREAYFINVNTDTLSPLTSPLQTGTNLVIDVQSLLFNTVEQITGTQPQYTLTAANYNPTYCVGYNCTSVLPNTTENGFSNIPDFLDNLFQTLGIRLEAYGTSPNFCQIGENNQFFKIQYRDGDTFFLSLKITYGSFVGIITITNTGNISEQTITIGKETTTFELCNTDLYCTAEDSDDITVSVWNEGCPQTPVETGVACKITPRLGEPGFSTKNCDPDRVISVKCKYADSVFALFKRMRYGIETCCEFDLDKIDIKNQLIDLGSIYDPDLCISGQPVPYGCCLQPCSVVTNIVIPQTIGCAAPTPPISANIISQDCRRVTLTPGKTIEPMIATFITCEGTPVYLDLTFDMGAGIYCIDYAQPMSISELIDIFILEDQSGC